jgi:pyrrolidone-carboxylate peptidase
MQRGRAPRRAGCRRLLRAAGRPHWRSVERFVHGRGFVHVPLLPEQALDTSVASMLLETLVRAARIVVVTSAAL